MKNILAAAIVTAGATIPAVAADVTEAPTGLGQAIGAELSHATEARAAQRLLLAKGYDTVSNLDRAPNGHWIGTATKAGKTIFVAVHLPKPAPGTN